MSVRIAVLSDSHVGQRISRYPGEFLSRLRELDLIIHAGDHTSLESLKILRKFGRVVAIAGNMDEVGITSELPEKVILDIENFKVGVIHGWGPPDDLTFKVRDKFFKDGLSPDIILFGHSHVPSDEFQSGTRLINPGSLSGNAKESFGSWGILTIENDEARWDLFRIKI